MTPKESLILTSAFLEMVFKTGALGVISVASKRSCDTFDWSDAVNRFFEVQDDENSKTSFNTTTAPARRKVGAFLVDWGNAMTKAADGVED
jgi:hypothetical protein